ncbi:hypothetical protein [Marinobacterium aestuariivivens]|uniref:Membrane transporter protein n=1 Tax=Marinobacterium aestuariivivens TaxID=1698799 RepID=A0ABW1ZXS5_9GAMM
MVVGPAYFFIATENDSAFVVLAALSSMNAMTATLVFTSIYLVVSHRVSLWLSLLLSSLGWLASIAFLLRNVESGVVSTLLFASAFAAAKWLSRRIRMDMPRQNTRNGGLDILWRAAAAGILVGIGTGLVSYTGPSLSGAIVGFPIGMTTILITLHRRHGHAVARATIAAAQTGMLSIFSFLLVLAFFPDAFETEFAFALAVSTALLTTSFSCSLTVTPFLPPWAKARNRTGGRHAFRST